MRRRRNRAEGKWKQKRTNTKYIYMKERKEKTYSISCGFVSLFIKEKGKHGWDENKKLTPQNERTHDELAILRFYSSRSMELNHLWVKKLGTVRYSFSKNSELLEGVSDRKGDGGTRRQQRVEEHEREREEKEENSKHGTTLFSTKKKKEKQ